MVSFGTATGVHGWFDSTPQYMSNKRNSDRNKKLGWADEYLRLMRFDVGVARDALKSGWCGEAKSSLASAIKLRSSYKKTAQKDVPRVYRKKLKSLKGAINTACPKKR